MDAIKNKGFSKHDFMGNGEDEDDSSDSADNLLENGKEEETKTENRLESILGDVKAIADKIKMVRGKVSSLRDVSQLMELNDKIYTLF